MNVEIRNPQGQPVTTADRSAAVAESLRQIARVSRFVDRKKGIRSYQSHVKSDPWVPILFVLCFVLPTLAGAVYYGLVASDQFVTEARFALRPALGTVDKATPDSVGTNAGVPHQMVAQDSLITANYIGSRAMVEVVASQMPLREMFGRGSIDYLSRFDTEEPIEKLLKYWRRRVDVEIEQGSGIISVAVHAFDPAESLAITKAIMAEAERMVNALTNTARNDALAESNRELKVAEDRLARIRVEVRDLRNRDGVLDAQKSNETNLKVIGELRANRIKLAVDLALNMRDLAPESRKIQDMKAQIKDIDDNIAKIENQSASMNPDQKRLLSDALTRFEALDNERKDAEKYYSKVLVASERARIIAERQIEFFNLVVAPVEAESSQQPRRVLMTSLIAAGAAVFFAAALFARKQMS